MTLERPDLSGAAPEIVAYIEALETELMQLAQSSTNKRTRSVASEPTEPPTPINVITLNKVGIIKRTPRHFYTRQRRGGMGVFDLETERNSPTNCFTAGR